MRSQLSQLVKDLMHRKMISRHRLERDLAEYASYTEALLEKPEKIPVCVVARFFDSLKLTSQEEAQLSIQLLSGKYVDRTSSHLR